jgi:hypothetical protein
MQNRFPLYLCLKISSFVAFCSFAQPGQARMNRSAIVRTSGVSDTWHLRRLGDRAGEAGAAVNGDVLAPLPPLNSQPARSLFPQLHFLAGLLFGLYPCLL